MVAIESMNQMSPIVFALVTFDMARCQRGELRSLLIFIFELVPGLKFFTYHVFKRNESADDLGLPVLRFT